MIWGGIGLNQRVGLVIFQNFVQGRGHELQRSGVWTKCSLTQIVPYFCRHENTIWQQDNACPHTARITQDFLQHHNI
ncbi:hypothetical protein LSAT2_027654, partial [Lamellibrachia satsuma]